METFPQLNCLHTFSGPSFPFPPFTRSTFLADSNSMRDKSGISSIHMDKYGILPPDHCSPCGPKKLYMHSNSFSSVNSENLSTCMEGLGPESFNDTDEFFKNKFFINNNDDKNNRELQEERGTPGPKRNGLKRSRSCSMGEYPPPISCIGKCGKPFVSFKSFRQDGRFILKEIRIPELLNICRENGRLKLQFIQSDDDGEDAIDHEDGKEENVDEKI